MITYKVHFIRTATTQTEENGGYVSHFDLPLSKTGTEHLALMRDSFAYPPVGMVYTSPLSRAVYTAQYLFEDAQIIAMDDLIDLDLGDFAGKTYSQLEPDPNFQNWLKDSRNTPPNGEATEDFVARIINALDNIIKDMMKNSLTEVAVVTHAGVIMSLLSSIGLPKMPIDNWFADNATGYTIRITPQLWMRDRVVEVIGRVPTLIE